MAQNVTTLQDEEGDYSDWIELHNTGAVSVELAGWHLSDTPTHLTRWTFPPTHLPAGGFLLVYASGKNKTETELHANFSLSAEGEYLALVHPDGITVEHEYREVPEQFPDISYGIQTLGTNPTLRAGEAGYLIVHTPGAANTCLPAPHPLYSADSVARVDIDISQSSWDALMDDPLNTPLQMADVRFRHGDLDLSITHVGIKCRGAATRELHPHSFTIDFNAFVPGQQMLDMEKLYFNATAIDPSTVRSRLIDDLHGAAGLTSPYANCVALVINGPEWDRGSETGGSFFDAIRCNTQPIDKGFLRQRYRNSHGNLYDTGGPASLEFLGPDGSSYQNLAYKLQVAGSGDTSFNDLADFIEILNQTPDIDFPHAMMKVFDVDGFLKCLALDVLTGNHDNYWILNHNYKLYRHPDTHRWIYIPYDYDYTFGIGWRTVDWTRQNIDAWNDIPGAYPAPLVTRILAVTDFRNRYRFYMKQIMETVYSNARLDPYLFHCRSAMTNALPFESGGIVNMKAAERSRYTNDWPNWTYDQFYQSYTQAPTFFTSHGLTEFIELRREMALYQMSRGVIIAPILSDFILLPHQPGTNDPIVFSVCAIDDESISQVDLQYSFQAGTTQLVAMMAQSNGSFAVTLPAAGTTGVLHYLIRAVDNSGWTTFHPYGGSNYTDSIEIGQPAHNLVVTELNYNPYPPTADEIAAGITDPQNFEFIEVYNAGDSPLDLTGFQITDGIGATAPAFVLGAGEYAVVVKNINAFGIRYSNTSVRIIGTFMGNLSNGGETLRLEDAQGNVISSITYSDSGSWPNRADGDGSALELIDFAGDFFDSANWRSSSEYGGSPGAAGSGPDNRIVINEVLTHTDTAAGDMIELVNTTDDALDIGGWTLSDSKENYLKYSIPSGTVLSANSYLVFDEINHFNPSGGVASNDFSFNGAHGDDLFLLQTDDQGYLTRFVDHVEFGAAANGESFGRWPDRSGRLYPMQCPTFGAANSGPRVGPLVISEIQFNPPSGSNPLEFIEIDNPSGSSEDLTHWQLNGGVDFVFPNNTFLPDDDRLVILSFDPNAAANSNLLADFRSTYGISTNVRLIGGYAGSLNNGGERIRLLRPDEPPMEDPSFFPMLIEDEVSYGSAEPWPLAPAGNGASLSRRQPAAWGDAPSNWTSAAPPTPGSVPSALTDYQEWAANKDIPGLCAINPLSGLSYAEEFLLQTNGADNLHHVSSSGPYSLYSHIPMISCGISNQLEVSTDLLNPSAWRSAFGGELLFLSNQTYRVNVPSEAPFFIRLQLIPVE